MYHLPCSLERHQKRYSSDDGKYSEMGVRDRWKVSRIENFGSAAPNSKVVYLNPPPHPCKLGIGKVFERKINKVTRKSFLKSAYSLSKEKRKL